MKKTISLVVPCYNEAKNLPLLIKALSTALPKLYNYELVIIDDGSADASVDIVKTANIKFASLKLVQFSRNFGKETAIYAGLKSAVGDAAVILDADLQHPVYVIEQFIAKWQEGYNMVYGVLETRRHQGRLRQWFSQRFYQILNWLSDTKIPANAGDFRLLDRQCIEAITSCQEHNLFMKGLYAWVGFKSCAVVYTADDREDGGVGRWSFWSLFNLAIEGLTSFSSMPLRIATVAGLVISSVSFIFGLWIILSTLVYGRDTPGFATIMVVMLFLGGIQLIAIGIVGEYIAKIFNEVKRRPHYIINEYFERKTSIKKKVSVSKTKVKKADAQ